MAPAEPDRKIAELETTADTERLGYELKLGGGAAPSMRGACCC